jgi:hypothetical protein
MSTPQDSASLLLRLYELRRDPELRAARDWFVTRFHPTTAQEVFAEWMGPDSAKYRMMTTYWEMAASFVSKGAIDADMFHAANTEYVAVIAKLQPYLADLRKMSGDTRYLAELEAVVMAMPDAEKRLSMMRKYMRLKAAEVVTGLHE